jgi:hypothetical protein
MKPGRIRDYLAGGDRRSIGRSGEVVKLLERQPRLLPELIQEMWNADQIVAMRAADALEKFQKEKFDILVTDYAIVARIHDNMTGQPVIIVAGILDKGTEAASEVLYNPVYLDALLAKAPKNWDRLNLEAVIETHLIEGHPGPPAILAVATW